MTKRDITGSFGSSTFSFLSNLHTNFYMTGLIYIPTNSAKEFLITASLPVLIVCFLDESYSDWGEMESQCSVDLHFFV
jgi:hypothetical protein